MKREIARLGNTVDQMKEKISDIEDIIMEIIQKEKRETG